RRGRGCARRRFAPSLAPPRPAVRNLVCDATVRPDEPDAVGVVIPHAVSETPEEHPVGADPRSRVDADGAALPDDEVEREGIGVTMTRPHLEPSQRKEPGWRIPGIHAQLDEFVVRIEVVLATGPAPPRYSH